MLLQLAGRVLEGLRRSSSSTARLSVLAGVGGAEGAQGVRRNRGTGSSRPEVLRSVRQEGPVACGWRGRQRGAGGRVHPVGCAVGGRRVGARGARVGVVVREGVEVREGRCRGQQVLHQLDHPPHHLTQV